jgi:hypothetical protein
MARRVDRSPTVGCHPFAMAGELVAGDLDVWVRDGRR